MLRAVLLLLGGRREIVKGEYKQEVRGQPTDWEPQALSWAITFRNTEAEHGKTISVDYLDGNFLNQQADLTRLRSTAT